MEVHHHPKVENPAHAGTGKKFKEYILEFIMIFLNFSGKWDDRLVNLLKKILLHT